MRISPKGDHVVFEKDNSFYVAKVNPDYLER
jgi:hypothetical protein